MEPFRRIVLQPTALQKAGGEGGAEDREGESPGADLELCIWKSILMEGEVTEGTILQGVVGRSQHYKASSVMAGVLDLCFVHRIVYT